MTIARTICLGFIAVILAGTSLLMLPVSLLFNVSTHACNFNIFSHIVFLNLEGR